MAPSNEQGHTTDGEDLTHLDVHGRPQMVNIVEKDVTQRTAIAQGQIRMSPTTLSAITAGDVRKGDVLQVARLAAIMGGKHASDLIPLCHQLPGTSFSVELEPDDNLPGIVIRVEAKVLSQTGVEMEALTAVSVGLLTVYDMAKSLDRGMVIENIHLRYKDGGKSGTWSVDLPST